MLTYWNTSTVRIQATSVEHKYLQLLNICYNVNLILRVRHVSASPIEQKQNANQLHDLLHKKLSLRSQPNYFYFFSYPQLTYIEKYSHPGKS